MRKLLLSLFTILLFVEANAQQGIIVQSDTVTQVGLVSDGTVTAVDHFTNKSGSPKRFTWIRDEQYLPQGWFTTVCDADNCFSTTTSSHTLIATDTIGNNQKTFINVNFLVNSPGTGVVKITYFYPTDTTYAWFIGTANFAAGINKVAAVKDIFLYPTPAKDNLFVAFNSSLRPNLIEIYNILGQKVKNVPVQPEVNSGKIAIEIPELNKGLYFIRVYSSNTPDIITKQFTKE